MKKIIALALTIAMIATLGVASFATTIYGGDNGLEAAPADVSATKNINLTVSEGDTHHRYKIDVEWSTTEIAVQADRTWNVNTHKYDYTFTTSSSAAEVKVTVTNHSDVDVNAKLTSNTTNNPLVTGIAATDPAAAVATSALDGNVHPLDLISTYSFSGAHYAQEGDIATEIADVIVATVTINPAA